MITRLKALKVMLHFTGYIPQMQYTREQENRKSHAKPKALGHVKEACFDSYDVFNMNMYLEFCG